MSSNIQHTDDRNNLVADLSRSAPNVGGIGWRAQVLQSLDNDEDTNDNASQLLQLNYLGRYGQAQVGMSNNDGNHSAYLSGTGALVAMGGGLFPTRQVNSGFAVVSTNGIADVPVLLQNNPIGITNHRGLLLVSPLNAYQENKIGIDAMGLPADLRIRDVAIDATPTDRAGTVVSFDLTSVLSASIILTDSDKNPLPIGSQVQLLTNKSTPSTVVGFDGEVYMDTLDEHNTLKVTTPSGDTCHVSFDYIKQGESIPLIGPLICQKV